MLCVAPVVVALYPHEVFAVVGFLQELFCCCACWHKRASVFVVASLCVVVDEYVVYVC